MALRLCPGYSSTLSHGSAEKREQQVEQKGVENTQIVKERKRVQSYRANTAVLFEVICPSTEKEALWSTPAQ